MGENRFSSWTCGRDEERKLTKRAQAYRPVFHIAFALSCYWQTISTKRGTFRDTADTGLINRAKFHVNRLRGIWQIMGLSKMACFPRKAK